MMIHVMISVLGGMLSDLWIIEFMYQRAYVEFQKLILTREIPNVRLNCTVQASQPLTNGINRGNRIPIYIYNRQMKEKTCGQERKKPRSEYETSTKGFSREVKGSSY